MKTQLKFSLALMTVAIIISTTCRAQPGSVSKRNSVIDSLHITDSDEKKVLALYDDCITEYLNAWRNFAMDPKKFTTAYGNAIDKKYQARAKELQPEIQNLQRKLAANTAELMKFVQFSQYESKRLVIVANKYQQAVLKTYGGSH